VASWGAEMVPLAAVLMQVQVQGQGQGQGQEQVQWLVEGGLSLQPKKHQPKRCITLRRVPAVLPAFEAKWVTSGRTVIRQRFSGTVLRYEPG
jgi:hypothetical protein